MRLLMLVMTLASMTVPMGALGQDPAQPGPETPSTFDQLKVLVGPGDSIDVTDASGARVSGRLVRLSSSTLTLKVGDRVRALVEGDVAAIRQRRGDSLRNGALWGLGTGASVAMIACGRCHAGTGAALALLWGGMGAGIGVGVDAIVQGKKVVFAPKLATSHKSVSVSVGF